MSLLGVGGVMSLLGVGGDASSVGSSAGCGSLEVWCKWLVEEIGGFAG